MGNAIQQVTPQDLDDAEISREVPCEVDPTWQRLEELRAGAPLRVPPLWQRLAWGILFCLFLLGACYVVAFLVAATAAFWGHVLGPAASKAALVCTVGALGTFWLVGAINGIAACCSWLAGAINRHV